MTPNVRSNLNYYNFFAVLVFELSRAFDWAVLATEHRLIPHAVHLGAVVPLVLLVLAMTTSYFINVNHFSLHSYYRNRLIRSYLGASNSERRPSAFTGFDEGDNRKMSKLPADKPIHVVNITLNLVHGSNLA